MKILYSKGTIEPDEVMKFLALSGQAQDIYAQIIANKEISKKAEELGLEVPDDDLQDFADKFRIARGLYSIADTIQYLRSTGLTEEDFAEFCELALLRNMLKDRLADEKRVREYLINNRQRYDRARVSQIIVDNAELAKEIYVRVADDDDDFHALARKYSRDESTKLIGGHLGLVSRQSLPIDISMKVFNAKPGDVLGPFAEEKLYQVILVEEVIKAEFNDDVRDAIQETIFEEWASSFLRDPLKVIP
jgi:peptidylprolyl isomerase